MNEEIEIHTIIYPPGPTSFPIVWRPSIDDMVPPRFAVWHPDNSDFQIFDIARMPSHSITVKPVRTERENPFYFCIQNTGDRQSRTITLYKPRASKHTHVEVAMWFTGAWLCKRSSARLQASIPIMGVSEPSQFPIKGNVGIYRNRAYIDWSDDYSSAYVREMIHNRKIYTSLHPIQEPDKTKSTIEEIPKFVASALLKDAMERNEVCPISMEILHLENAVVTSCFHIFEKNSIQTWLSTKSCCPICKKECVTTCI
jgi:hypothetical protein